MCNNRINFTVDEPVNIYAKNTGCAYGTGYSPNDRRAIEPTAQNASMGTVTTNVVANDAVIPISTIYTVSGAHISGTSPISLRAGHKYLVEFTVIGFSSAPANPFGAKLRLNGVDVAGSQVALSSLATSLSVSGGTIVSTFGMSNAASASLTLNAIALTTATYQYASIRIVEVE